MEGPAGRDSPSRPARPLGYPQRRATENDLGQDLRDCWPRRSSASGISIPNLVWPFIDEWQSGSPEQQEGATLDALVELAARDLIDCDFRELLGRRLARQSELLLRTGKDELAYLSSVASRTLDPESAVAAQHHPFVRALIMSSFFNAGLRLPQAYASAVAADGGDGHG